MFEFCIPTTGTKVPSSPDWLHEIKFDGYRLRLERDGDRVRLITRGGYNWTDRYPWIVEATLRVRQKRFVFDGEAVILLGPRASLSIHSSRARSALIFSGPPATWALKGWCRNVVTAHIKPDDQSTGSR